MLETIVHTHLYVYINIDICCSYTIVRVYMNIYMYNKKNMFKIYLCVYIHVYIHMYIHTYVYLYMNCRYIHMHIHIYIHIYICIYVNIFLNSIKFIFSINSNGMHAQWHFQVTRMHWHPQITIF